MFISTAGRSLTTTFASVGCKSRHVPRNSQIQSILLVSRRFKTSEECKPPRKSRKLLTAAGFAIAGTTLAVVAAKNDDDFRDWSKKHLPALDSLVRVVYREEETYLEFLDRAFKELAEGIKDVLYNMSQTIKESGKKKGGHVEEIPKESSKPKEPEFKISDSAFANEDKQVPASLKHLKALEDKLFKETQDAMKVYNLAVQALKDKTNLIDNLDQLVSRHDCKLWDKLKTKIEDEMKFSDRFLEAIEKVEQSAESLRLQMSKTPELTLDVKQIAENNIKKSLATVNKAKDNLNKDKESKLLAKRSWDKVRMARMYFSELLETIFPNVWLNDEKLNLAIENLDPFTENVLESIQYVEKDFYKLETFVEAQIKNATEVAKDNSSGTKDAVTKVFVDLETAREKRLGREELQKAMLTNEAKCEKANRKALKDLSEVYSDLKKEALIIRERDVERRMKQLLDERLAQLRADHQLELARMVGRIQGANEAIALRGDNEKEQQKKLQFWSAAQSLFSAVKPYGASDKPKELKPLKNEIKNLTKAAPDGDELVKSVVSTIPPEAVECGVASEECLKKRFLMVEKHARHLAGLPTGPVTLLGHILSRVESAVHIDEPIPQAELNNEPIDIEELNNYQLLQRARYFVDLGEMNQAVRYLNLLKGPARDVASDWVKDVIVHQETVQAARLLLAYASTFNQ